MMEETPNGIPYEYYITSSHGARFILYPDKDATKSDINYAKGYLWAEHDVVQIRIERRDYNENKFREMTKKQAMLKYNK